ncbi:hypothetical protein Hdeb2414_s0016g00497631 [Helianthus debilis subsp. tardiflorus]
MSPLLDRPIRAMAQLSHYIKRTSFPKKGGRHHLSHKKEAQDPTSSKRNRHNDDKMTNLNRSSPNLRLVPPHPLNDLRDLGIRHWRHPWDQVQACLGPFKRLDLPLRDCQICILTPVIRFRISKLPSSVKDVLLLSLHPENI